MDPYNVGGGFGAGGGFSGGGDGHPAQKRYKRNDTDPMNPEPSIVVHARNLSPKTTEADLLEALSHFGNIAYATCMPNKRMALVEFEEIEAARKCVVFSQTAPIHVAGSPALFNYSTSQMIQRIGLEDENPNHVLVLTIYNNQYAVNVDVIYQICSPHGKVLRIAMIKRNLLQALVEFEDVETARKAKYAMNGADIYSGCCTLKVEFAKPDRVKVMRNDDSSWDYTIAADSSQAPASQRRALLTDDQRPAGSQAATPAYPVAAAPPYEDPYASQAQPAYVPYTAPPQDPTAAAAASSTRYSAAAAEAAGASWRQGLAAAEAGGAAAADYGGLTFRRDAPWTSTAGPNRGAMPRGYQQVGGGGAQQQPFEGYYGSTAEPGDYSSQQQGGSSVVMLYGVNHDQFNCQKIYNLLCCYGNCLKVKFMRLKTDTCMAEMGGSKEVGSLMRYIHNAKAFGQDLTLRPSKQTSLREMGEPFDMPDGTPSFVDYTRSRNHRFSTPESAARNRLNEPTNQLHWFNAPASMNEERLAQVFEVTGAKLPKKVTIFNTRSDRSASGLAEFESVEEATEALMLANHTAIPEVEGRAPYVLKLAFGGGRN